MILELQQDIISQTEKLDGQATFAVDRWQRDAADPNAGYGITAVLESGHLLEKAAANITVVKGVLSPARAQAMSSRGRSSVDPAGGQTYEAAAMSLVFHPAHPLVPTLRADVRLFGVGDDAFFGGGCDLTPAYLFPEDAVSFHAYWRDCLELHGDTSLYPQWKAWCDRYFYLPARREHRGIGGIFFDDLAAEQSGFDVEELMAAVGRGILASWTPIVARRAAEPYTEAQRQWQLLRRGRYLEFNLLYDRGVKFGLDGGRIEAIMVSAPPLIAWRYNVVPDPGSPEEALVAVLAEPRDWVEASE